MNVIFKNKSEIIEGVTTTEDVIEKINNLVEDNYYFSHLIVDGQEVYETLEEILLDGFTNIRELEIIAKTESELINDVLLTTEDYIKRAKPEMELLANAFYKNPSRSDWEKYSQLLEGIQWINQMVVSIDSLGVKSEVWEAFLIVKSQIELNVKELQVAMNNQDIILMGDLIQYELKPLFENLEVESKNFIDSRGVRHDSN